MASSGPRVSSMLAEAEFAFAVQHKELRGELRIGGAAELVNLFRKDVGAGHIQLYPLSRKVIAQSVEFAITQRRPGSLRTLDGLHMAAAILLRCRAVATADQRMQEAAAALGMDVIAPQ